MSSRPAYFQQSGSYKDLTLVGNILMMLSLVRDQNTCVLVGLVSGDGGVLMSLAHAIQFETTSREQSMKGCECCM
jgi:hypothetical protein